MIRVGVAKLAICAALGAVPGSIPRASMQSPPPQTPVKQAPETPIAETKEELGKPSWDPAWDRIVERALPPEMLSDRMEKAVKPFCPRFHAMSEVDRRAFWAYVFQALAGAEAALVPTTNVQHFEPEVAVKDTVTLRMVRAEGLLQLTYMDADRYGCDFDWEHDKDLPLHDPSKTILQPENNLLCGVKILSNQLINRRKPLVTQSSYWSTLHPRGLSHKVFMKQMTNIPEVCSEEPAIREANDAESGGMGPASRADQKP